MRIQAVNTNISRKLSFGEVDEGMDESFYSMPKEDKLDKIYDMLKEQKQDLITLSRNQYSMQNFNDIGFRLTAANSAGTAEIGKKSDKIINNAAASFKIDVLG